ncbi:MAG: phosphatidate cytidylyltransferase [Alphaproteobacteria bacterium]
METPDNHIHDDSDDEIIEVVNKEAPPPSKWSGLPVRIASAVVLAALFIMLLKTGGWLFNWFVFMAAMMMIREWNNLTDKEEAFLRLAGMFYVSIPCASLVWLRGLHNGMELVLYVMGCVVATDIGAYFAGRQFGQHKLAPAISPGKTWEGLGGGMLAAGIVGGIAQLLTYFPASIAGGVLLGMTLAVVAQCGDLFESWIKRRAGVKDSGTLIPGHGGLLDRIDGLIFTLPLFALMAALA